MSEYVRLSDKLTREQTMDALLFGFKADEMYEVNREVMCSGVLCYEFVGDYYLWRADYFEEVGK